MADRPRGRFPCGTSLSNVAHRTIDTIGLSETLQPGARVVSRRTRVWIREAAVALLAASSSIPLLACGRDSGPPSVDSTRAEPQSQLESTPPATAECERLGYACAWDQVDLPAFGRVEAVIALAREASLQGARLDDLAELLSNNQDVVWVQHEEGRALRFLARGARPVWITPPDTSGSRTLSGSRPTTFQSPEQGVAGSQAISDVNRKRALFLAPYQWEANVAIAQYEALFKQTRDYYWEGGLNLVFNDYSPEDRARRCFESSPSDCQPVQIRTSYRDFLGWEVYDLIHVMTHGVQICGIFDGPYTCRTMLYTGARAPLETLMTGLEAKLRNQLLDPLGPRHEYNVPGNQPGVEYAWSMPSLVCVGSDTFYLSRNNRGSLQDAGYVPIEEGTPMWEEFCTGTVPDGTYLEEVVTEEFFFAAYKQGLPDKVILLTACESMRDRKLAKHLAARERSAVVGWTRKVNMKLADRVAYRFLALLLTPPLGRSERTVEQHLESAARRGGGYWADFLKDVVDRVKKVDNLAVGGTEPAPVTIPLGPSELSALQTAELVVEGRGQMRAREIVAILDQNQGGAELADGGRASVLGAPGDGREDQLDVILELQGVSEEEDPSEFTLNVSVDGRQVPGSYTAAEPSGDGTYWARGPIDLGADLTRNQVSDLEIWTLLPSGGVSRWRYEDVRLGLPCRFELTIDDTTYVSSSGDMLLSMGMAGTAHLVSVEHKGAEAFATLMVEGSSPLVVGTLSANLSGAVGGSDSGPTTLLGPVTLEVTESTTDLMVGHASGSIQSLAPPYQLQEMVPFSVRFEIGLDEEASDQFAAIGGAGMLAGGMAGGAAFDPSAMAGMDLSRLMGGMTGQVVGCEAY